MLASLALAACARHQAGASSAAAPSSAAAAVAPTGLPGAGAPSTPPAPVALNPALEEKILASQRGAFGAAASTPSARSASQPSAASSPAGATGATVAAASAGAPSASLSGTLDAAPAVKDHLAACSTLFLIVRQAGGDHSVLAVRKYDLSAQPLPLGFEIDGSNAVLPGSPPFAGAVVLTARTDRDGEGLTKDSGCLQGEAPVTIPAAHLHVVLDSVLP